MTRKNADKEKGTIPMSPEQRLEQMERLDNRIREIRSAARSFPSQRVLELQAQLAKGSRDMFLEHLANALDGQASLGEIRALSSEDPLKGAQVLQIYSKLAGVAERQEVAVNPDKIPMSEAIALLRQFGFTIPDRLFPHEIEAAAEPSSAPLRSLTTPGTKEDASTKASSTAALRAEPEQPDLFEGEDPDV